MLIKRTAPVTSLNLSAMIGAHIEYAYTQNLDGSADLIETGVVQSVKELKNGKLEMFVVPDNANHMAKYRIAEDHLIRYLHEAQTEVRAQQIA